MNDLEDLMEAHKRIREQSVDYRASQPMSFKIDYIEEVVYIRDRHGAVQGQMSLDMFNKLINEE